MNTGEYLSYATDFLRSKSIETARLDTLVLMEFVLGIDRARILAEPKTAIVNQQKNVLNHLLAKRAKHIPIAYLTQSSEFYGRSFYINDSVLVPRPESETIISLLKQLLANDKQLASIRKTHDIIKLADIGTGCGALGITATLECPDIVTELIDIDRKALEVAQKNVVTYTINTKLIEGDLLVGNSNSYDILLCNLPYIPDDFNINLAAGHEPKNAIFGGHDGLYYYRKLFKILNKRQQKPLYILTECLPPAHSKLASIAQKSGYILQNADDFIQLYRHEL